MDKQKYSNFSLTLRPIQVLKASLMKTSELLLLLSFFLRLITHLHIHLPWPILARVLVRLSANTPGIYCKACS